MAKEHGAAAALPAPKHFILVRFCPLSVFLGLLGQRGRVGFISGVPALRLSSSRAAWESRGLSVVVVCTVVLLQHEVCFGATFPEHFLVPAKQVTEK